MSYFYMYWIAPNMCLLLRNGFELFAAGLVCEVAVEEEEVMVCEGEASRAGLRIPSSGRYEIALTGQTFPVRKHF